MFPKIVIAAGLTLYGFIILMTYIGSGAIAEKKFQTSMKSRGRFRPWTDLVPELNSGQGTLIVQLVKFGPTHGILWRIWWTEECARELAPYEPSGNKPTCGPGENLFADWCLNRYANAESGMGVLTKTDVPPPDEKFIVPDPLDELGDTFRQLFPSLQIVVLPIVLINEYGTV